MKITRKMLNSYLASERAGLDGIGFNDAWNLQKYGMTRETAAKIRRAITDEYGPFGLPSSTNLAAISARIERMK